MPERIISGQPQEEDAVLDTTLRPKSMDDFVGQAKIKDNLSIAVAAAQQRGEHLQILAHVYGRLIEGEPQHPLDHELVREADAQGKAALGGDTRGEGLLRHGRGVAGVGRNHRRSQLDAARRPPHEGQGGKGVEAEDVSTFSEQCTPAVEEANPRAVQEVLDILEKR